MILRRDETNMIFAVAKQLGLLTYQYMWILTRNVIENQFYKNFKYTNFPVGSLGSFFARPVTQY